MVMNLASIAALVAILVPALVLAANAGPASASTNSTTIELPPQQETPPPTDEACPGGGYDPVPVEVGVEAVPIVVESTTEEYFVLYVRHDLGGTVLELPVSVTLGENGTTTLAENVEALPKERYLVEKFLIADPADIDGDCIDDITELADPVGMNPVNPAAAINLTDGAVGVPDRGTFEALAYYESYLKFVLIDLDTSFPSVYFMNTTTHDHHSHFLRAIGVQRNQEMVVGSLFYVEELDAPDGSRGLYSYRLPTSYFPISLVERSYTVLAASMPLLSDNLAFNLRNTILSSFRADLPLYSESRVNLVFDIEIYADTGFLALNTGEGYGLLRAIGPDERPHHRDIVIYGALPNDLPRVAGIVSTVPQTPLSHVNLRAIQDRVPNAYIRDALDEDSIDDLIGSYVHYKVTEDGWEMRAATRAEVDAHHAASRPAHEQTPQRDLSITSITPLSEIGFGNWTAFGVKAANVAVLGTLGFPNGTVPDGFAVPFYFYDEFMKHNGFYDDIEEMLADPDFQANYTVQESELKGLRKAIKDAETPGWITAELEEMHGEFPNGTSLRYRSSTNNEDLPGFNGAGLYDSKTQHPEETEEDGISKSLKQVYASLWNFRAFAERDFYRINHTAAAMGVLVHPNYSDELANGVAVSFDPIYYGDGSYYVNTQLGEDLVTNPDAHSIPEEILLNPSGSYAVLATSNQVPLGQLLMSDDQLAQLGRHLTVIHEEFRELYNPGSDDPFAMEIEFKITSDNILAIKQARPWVFSTTPADTTAPTLASIERYSPAVENTDSQTLVYKVTFSEDVTGVDAGDFVLSQGSAGAGSTASLTGSGSVYYATVSAARDGTYNLDLVSSGHGITDAADNPLADPNPTGADHTYAVSATVTDSTAPTLASIERSDPSGELTPASTLVFEVTFSEAVQNVDAGDFELSGTGAGSITVSAVSGDTYNATVAVNTDGTFNLNIAGGHNIEDLAGTGLSSVTPTGADQSYTVDRTAPAVTSIVGNDPSGELTSESTLVFAVTFSEDVTGVDLSDFALSPDSTGGGSGSGQFTQTSEPATRIADRSTIQDAITVDRSGTATPVSVAVDITHTYIGDLVIDLIAPDGTTRTLHDRTGYETDDIDQTYAPDFGGVGIAGDWTLRIRDGAGGDTGTLNGWTLTIGHGTADSPVTGLTGSGDAYLVTVSAARDGTYNLDLVSSGHGITDAASNPLANTAPTGADHTYAVSTTVTDSTAPTLASIERSDPSGELTPASTLVFEVTFSEAVQNVDAGDFELSGTGAGSITVSAVSGDTYNATVAVNTDGTFNLNIAGGHNIEDLAGTGLSSVTPTGADQSYTVDRTAPAVTSIVGNDPSGELTSESTLVFAVTFSEDVTGVDLSDFALSSGGTGTGSVTNLAGSGSQYLVTVSAAQDGTYNLDLVSSGHGITDTPGNPLNDTSPTGEDQSYTVTILNVIPNSMPSVDAGSDQTVQENSVVTLSGTASDADDDPLTYLWSHDSDLIIALSDAASLSTSFTAPQVDSDTTITFTLAAYDETSNATDTTSVTITDSTPPVVADAPRSIGSVTLASTVPGVVEASWDAPAEEPGDYRIAWAKVGEGFRTWTDLTVNAFPTTTSHAITDLEEGAEYKVIVRARYDGGSGDWSGQYTVTVKARVQDTTDPTITLTGANPVSVTTGTAYSDPGATCTDDTDASPTLATTSTVDTLTAGTYQVTYTCTDSSSNTATATRDVVVADAPDTTDPTITLTGANPVSVTTGTAYSDPGATCTDDTDASPTLATTSSVDTLTAGTYQVTYTCTDSSSNTATATRDVVVADAPRSIGSVTLASTVPGVVEASWDAPAEEPGDYRIAWAKVGEGFRTWTDLTVNAFPTTTSHAITDLEEGAEYKVMVRARYDGGSGDWSGQYTVTVKASVQDTTDPTITLTGANPVSVTTGTAYSDPGATCTDDTDASPTLATTSSVDTLTAGTYQVTYTCTDSSSNTATATRDVVVADAPDTTDPTITLTGANPVSVTTGTAYSDPGATCTDDTDASPTLATTSTVDTLTAGTYQVTYTCTDSSSNTATATRDVVVADAPDTTAPTVSSIERHIPTDQNTGSQTLVYRVTFSENVTGVDVGDFVLSPDSPVAGGASGQFAQTSEPAIPIPDRNTIQDSITVEQSGTATSVSVAVDITHTYIGDLVIDLIAPDGTTRTLHDSTGYETDDIDQTYAPDFGGVGIAGDWTLRVRDGAGGDTGTLNGWTLTINHGSTASPVTEVSGSGDTYQVTVSATRDGTYNLDLVSPGHGIVDAAGNPLADTTPTGTDHTYTVSTAT